jgi:hypothetical protein
MGDRLMVVGETSRSVLAATLDHHGLLIGVESGLRGASVAVVGVSVVRLCQSPAVANVTPPSRNQAFHRSPSEVSAIAGIPIRFGAVSDSNRSNTKVTRRIPASTVVI